MDGITWQFFRLSRLDDGTFRIYGSGKIVSQDRPSSQRVLGNSFSKHFQNSDSFLLGLLTFFIGGQMPGIDKAQPIFLEERKDKS